jgi:hypothetical protein
VSSLDAATLPEDVERQVEACLELLSYLHNDLLPKLPPSDHQREHWSVVLALSAGATTTYEAAVRLAEAGFGYQAAMLNRSLFEAMVDCYWTVMNAALALRRLREHTSYMARVNARKSARFPRQFGDLPAPEPLSADEEKRLSKRFRGGSGSWTGFNLYERVDAISERWPEGMAREHLFFLRDIANSINNYLLHPTPWGMARMTRPLEDAPGVSAGRRAEVGPGSAFRSEALFGSFWIAGSLARLLLEECSLGADAFEEGLYARGIHAFVSIRPEALRNTGRNDPCPCGSGLKFKRCHGR